MVRVAAIAAVLAVGLAAPRATAHAPASHGNDRWALIVGVSAHTGKMKPAIGAAGDAADTAQALRDAGFPSEHVRVLTGRDTSAANIRSGLDWLAAHSSESSFSVFHYSGHVKQQGGDADSDGEKVDEFLWPYDHQYIADGELAARLNGVRGWLWADIAGCESAGFNDGISGPRHLFTSSSAEAEKSYELPSEKRSVMTKLFVGDALLRGRGDANGDGRVSLQEAYVYAADNAPNVTRKQRRGPQHPHLYGGDGEEWFLNAPPPPPQPATESDRPQNQPPPPEDSAPPRNCVLSFCA